MFEKLLDLSLVHIIAIALSSGGFVWFYLRYLAGLNIKVFIGLILVYMAIATLDLRVSIFGLFVMLFLIIWGGRIFSIRTIYEPAVAKIEGGGIKRGLTPPEAAAVLAKPYSKIILLVILQLLRKKVLEITIDGTAIVKVASQYSFNSTNLTAKERANKRNMAAQTALIVLYPYEQLFIEFIDLSKDKKLIEFNFDVLLKPFFSHVASRIAGYDFDGTQAYYRAIIKRAPVEARTDGKLVSAKDKIVEKNILWILLHEEAEQLLMSEFDDYCPTWCPMSNDGKDFANFLIWFKFMAEQIQSSTSGAEIRESLLNASTQLTDRIDADITKATFNG